MPDMGFGPCILQAISLSCNALTMGHWTVLQEITYSLYHVTAGSTTTQLVWVGQNSRLLGDYWIVDVSL